MGLSFEMKYLNVWIIIDTEIIIIGRVPILPARKKMSSQWCIFLKIV